MKKNKNIIILLFVSVVGIVDVTIAYFSSTITFENEFQISEYGTTHIEKFVSLDNWLPGDVTEKTLEVRNSGSVDEAIRVKVEEKWINKNGEELPLEQDGNVVTQINYINSSDWITLDIANEDYYYYYYNYKLAPEETTSKLLDKVTFNPLINAKSTCVDTVEDGVTTRVCNSDGTGYDGETYTLKLTVETVQYNKYKEAWGTGNTITLLDEKPEPPKPAAEYLTENATNPSTITSYNDASADKGKMFYFTHTLNEGAENEKTVNETRYIGNEPKNYVKFNCDEDGKNCETWRILVVFDVEREVDDEENLGQKKTITEQRMKLVRESSIKNDYWDTAEKNDWTTSTLKTYLNTDYYNSLQTTAKSMIDEAKYYLGAVSYNSGFGTTEKIYGEERGTTVCGACNGDESKLIWQWNVGLMYPSDEYMVYGNDVNITCYTNPKGCAGTNAQTGWVYNGNKLSTELSQNYQQMLLLKMEMEVLIFLTF